MRVAGNRAVEVDLIVTSAQGTTEWFTSARFLDVMQLLREHFVQGLIVRTLEGLHQWMEDGI